MFVCIHYTYCMFILVCSNILHAYTSDATHTHAYTYTYSTHPYTHAITPHMHTNSTHTIMWHACTQLRIHTHTRIHMHSHTCTHIIVILMNLLQFSMDSSDYSGKVLWISVWDWKRFSKSEFLGEIMVPLWTQDLTDKSTKMYPLEPVSIPVYALYV